MRRSLIFSLAGLLIAGTVNGPELAAQDRMQQRDRDQRLDSAQRDSLEVRVRTRMGQVLKNQLGLSDDQVRQLQATNRQFEGRRRDLFAQERDSRMELRRELQRGDSTSQQQVGVLLDRMMQLQRQRLDMVEAEQKELATFLTPVQRARLFGMEEQLRQRMGEMRDGAEPGASRPPGRMGQPPRQGQPRGQPGGQRRPPPRQP